MTKKKKKKKKKYSKCINVQLKYQHIFFGFYKMLINAVAPQEYML